MTLGRDNLFDAIPVRDCAEEFIELLARPGLRIERIVSNGQASAPGMWYDQTQCEWVLVLSGEAAIAFDDGTPTRRLEPGDFLDIPAHRRHRVEWTHPAVPTIWLAVYYDAGGVPGSRR